MQKMIVINTLAMQDFKYASVGVCHQHLFK